MMEQRRVVIVGMAQCRLCGLYVVRGARACHHCGEETERARAHRLAVAVGLWGAMAAARAGVAQVLERERWEHRRRQLRGRAKAESRAKVSDVDRLFFRARWSGCGSKRKAIEYAAEARKMPIAGPRVDLRYLGDSDDTGLSYSVLIRRIATGEERLVPITSHTWKASDWSWWVEGNFACDCNRRACVWEQRGVRPDELCGTHEFRVIRAVLSDGSHVELQGERDVERG